MPEIIYLDPLYGPETLTHNQEKIVKKIIFNKGIIIPNICFGNSIESLEEKISNAYSRWDFGYGLCIYDFDLTMTIGKISWKAAVEKLKNIPEAKDDYEKLTAFEKHLMEKYTAHTLTKEEEIDWVIVPFELFLKYDIDFKEIAKELTPRPGIFDLMRRFRVNYILSYGMKILIEKWLEIYCPPELMERIIIKAAEHKDKKVIKESVITPSSKGNDIYNFLGKDWIGRIVTITDSTADYQMMRIDAINILIKEGASLEKADIYFKQAQLIDMIYCEEDLGKLTELLHREIKIMELI